MAIDPTKFSTSTPVDSVSVTDFGPAPTDAEIAASRAHHAAAKANATPYAQADLDSYLDDVESIDWLRFEKTVEDNARLRALIKAAEWVDGPHDERYCPWCGVDRETAGAAPNQTHFDTCPAFTPEGAVR